MLSKPMRSAERSAYDDYTQRRPNGRDFISPEHEPPKRVKVRQGVTGEWGAPAWFRSEAEAKAFARAAKPFFARGHSDDRGPR
jgi:hypothetical protein